MLKRKPGYALSETLYEALREDIQQGRLKAGEKLTEVALAEKYNMSRTPVREALRRLQSESLVEASGRSFVIASLKTESVAELCAVRCTLEGLAGYLAATRRSETDLMVLRDLMENMRRATQDDDLDTLIKVNQAFHSTIWYAAHNSYLTKQLQELRQTIERMQSSTLQTRERRLTALKEHELMIQALERSDADALMKITEEHFRKAEAIRLSLLRMTEFS